jgi:hypothetical protein
MPDIYLWSVPSDANANDVRLRDPTTTGTVNYQVDAQAGTYSLTGQALTVSRNRVATVQNGSYTLTGQSATVSRNRVTTPSNGVYSLSGQVITVDYAGGAVNYQIDAQAGSYALTGQAITVAKSAPAYFVDGGWGKEKPAPKKQRKVRKDLEEAYALLLEHPEPSIAREVQDIVGNAQLDTLAQHKVTQLLTLAREVEEEELLMLLL